MAWTGCAASGERSGASVPYAESISTGEKRRGPAVAAGSGRDPFAGSCGRKAER